LAVLEPRLGALNCWACLVLAFRRFAEGVLRREGLASVAAGVAADLVEGITFCLLCLAVRIFIPLSVMHCKEYLGRFQDVGEETGMWPDS
jgi:hypothetical protein